MIEYEPCVGVGSDPSATLPDLKIYTEIVAKYWTYY